jgi:ferrochelatase
LFNTSFSYENYFFDYIRLPYLYIHHFIALLEFISKNKYLDTNIDITQLKNTQYLSPIFIDNNYKILDFGKSNRFIISNKNNDLIDSQIEFLKSKYEFGKLDIIKDYKDDIDLFNIIKKSNFNALYIIGKSKENIENILKNSQKKQIALFS